MKNIIIGILFAMLWASASPATKFGLLSADPLIIANVRFFIAGGLMLFYAHFIQKEAIPPKTIWRRLTIFAILNTTVYLAAFVLALREVSAGIGSLSTATGPLFVIIISTFWLNRILKWYEALGVVIGLSGAILAIWPLLQNSHASIRGVLILAGGIVSVSTASVYYSKYTWNMPRLVFNGWQVMIGGILLLPFTIYFSNFKTTKWDMNFWFSTGWLILPVSIISLQFWFYLLKEDAVKASLWLFLCPVFGFTYASFLFNEPISWHTYLGTFFVITGLYIAQFDKFTSKFLKP